MTERWRIGDRIQDRYEVYKIKGGPDKSGMGIVYLCYDHEFKEPVALKTFQEGFLSSKKARDDFTKEALTWVKLDRHKNIVRAHYVDVIEGRPYIFLEYVAGGSLDGWIGTKMLDLPLALKFAVEFCNGMEFTHKKLGLVHRDVKPGNILITQDKTVKVTDFGLAKAVVVEGLESPAVPSHDAAFLQSRPAGTCCWMAPEQWTGGDIDTRADIYAFGIVLYQMITGNYPYPLHSNWLGVHPKEWQTVHLKGSPQPITQEIPRELNDLVFKCLEKDPARRYQSFSELKEELLEIYYRFTGKRIVLEETPEVLEAWELVNKGFALVNLGRSHDGIACYDKALEIDPRYADAWYNKGAALGNLRRHQEAIGCFDKALEINPRYADVWINKGLALGKLERYHEAIDCYDKALKINPRHAEAWYNKGAALGKLERLQEAIACFDEALEINPRHDRAWYDKGGALGKLERLQEAIACFDKALEINPRDADTWYNKGVALGSLGRVQEAIDCYDEALEINSIYAEAWNNKGNALTDLGRHQEAIDCYNKALEINPRDAIAWYNKANVLVSQGRYQEAIDCYDKAVEINPRYAEAWYSKGVVMVKMGRPHDEIACYDKALEINPRYAEAWYNKGIALGEMERYHEAIACFDKALEINPRYTDAWYNKGVALKSLGRYQKAINSFQKSIELAPSQYATLVREAGEIIRQLRNEI